MRADATTQLRTLYPSIEAYQTDMLSVGQGHEIYVEQSGNPAGIPILFIHGGPGGGTNPVQRRFFNPEKFRIILFDQRGCGKSHPSAGLEANTTWHLVEDMETIRRTLGIDRWALFGGSWGSTLALIYAQTYPDTVSALILRGIFLMRQEELDWFYRNGTSAIFPEAWERFKSQIPADEHHDLVGAYYRRLTEDRHAAQRLHFAREWSLWEGSTVTLVPDESQRSHSLDPMFALAFARIEAHYFKHKGFLDADGQLLRDAGRLKNIETHIIQGRYDAICPPRSAVALAKAMPWANLKIVPVAGHSAFESAIQHELICATDAL